MLASVRMPSSKYDFQLQKLKLNVPTQLMTTYLLTVLRLDRACFPSTHATEKVMSLYQDHGTRNDRKFQ